MHPFHVARFVKAEVEELRKRAACSGLPILGVELEDDVDLYLQLELTRRARLATRQNDGSLLVGAGLFGDGGVALMNVPDLSQRPQLVCWQLYCNLGDFDTTPPTAELLDNERNALPAEQWPSDPKGQGIVNGHPDFERPWFCRKGFREFHSHPEHEDDPWDELRGSGAPLHALVLGLVYDLSERFFI